MEYKINDETLAVLPINQTNCEVIERKGNIPLDYSSMKVIEDSCEYFGVNYKARRRGTYNFINTRYKAPIIIEEKNRIIFFPLTSPSKNSNLWISYNNVLEYKPSNVKNETIVKFKSGISIMVPSSYYSFNNQYSKAARLFASYEVRTSKNW